MSSTPEPFRARLDSWLGDPSSTPVATRENRASALVCAVMYNEVSAAATLMADPRVNPNIGTYNFSTTPLIEAIGHGFSELVQILISDDRVDLYRATKRGLTPTFMLGRSKCPKVLQMFVTCRRFDLNHKDADGMTALHHAAYAGNIIFMSMLLEDPRVNPNARTDHVGTPLICAEQRMDARSLEFLLNDDRVDPMCETARGSTPLSIVLGRFAQYGVDVSDLSREVYKVAHSTTRVSCANLQIALGEISKLGKVSRKIEAIVGRIIRDNKRLPQ